MQVLDYQTQPIAPDHAGILASSNPIGTDSPADNTPVNDIINATIDALNQTFEQIVGHPQNNQFANASANSFENDWNFLYFLRILFYILVLMKILELVFIKRKKMDIKERVYRKYVFSYAELIRDFDNEDRDVMNTTLKNTIKNASMDQNLPKMVKKTSTKKVIFHQTKNEYIEPVKRGLQGTDPLSELQMFLSRPVKIEPVDQQVPEMDLGQNDASEGEVDKKETGDQSEIFVQKEGKESSITESTTGESLLRPESILEVEQGSKKEKDL